MDEEAADAEVGELGGRRCVGDHDGLRLDRAVDDALCVGVGEGVAEIGPISAMSWSLSSPAGAALAQGAALDELGDHQQTLSWCPSS